MGIFQMALSVSFIALLVIVASYPVNAAVPFDPDLDVQWENFKRTFNKQYSGREEAARRLIWENHVVDIIKHNLEYDLGIHKYRKGLNEFADISHNEAVETLNGFRSVKLNKSVSTFIPPSNINLPDTVDWRQKGLVTSVKNQGPCGSCWAFSATGSLEGQHKKKTGDLVSLSEQNLVDCSRFEGNLGCRGGIMELAFKYIKENDGIDTEVSYPYTAKEGICHFKKASIGATCTGYVYIPYADESALQKAVATIGPISVAIDASPQSFLLYKGGIYDEPKCNHTFLDHGVLIVGYGSENGDDYWLVKNSWGNSWGENGYIKMSRNKDNQCGIASHAVYPLV